MHAGTNSCKLKDNGNFLGVGMVKNGCGQSGDRTLKLTVSEGWIDGVNWFFLYVDTVSPNLKVDKNFFGWAW